MADETNGGGQPPQADDDTQATEQNSTDHSPEAAQVGTSDGDGESS